ncbi:MAG: hypothetical protein WD278_08940 [Pirellulales bacterium]
MNRLTAEQVRRNLAGRDRWQAFEGHRRRVTELLTGTARSAADRLCVLGAGNANDIDLGQLTSAFAEVHLVDLDSEALDFGLLRQQPAMRDRIHLHRQVDVTGAWDLLAAWSPEALPTPDEIDRCIERVTRFAGPALPAPFDAAASVCLVSQLVEGAVAALGHHHARLLELIVAIRTSHLRMLAQLVRPGGRGLLVTDFVSSDTVPGLADASEQDLPAMAGRLLEAGNFFHGLNPQVLHRVFTADPLIGPLIEESRLHGPWRWDLGPRMYLVAAIECTRRW